MQLWSWVQKYYKDTMGQECEKLDILQDLIFFVKITEFNKICFFVGETISYLYLILIFHAGQLSI